jgi:hypothetical protein
MTAVDFLRSISFPDPNWDLLLSSCEVSYDPATDQAFETPGGWVLVRPSGYLGIIRNQTSVPEPFGNHQWLNTNRDVFGVYEWPLIQSVIDGPWRLCLGPDGQDDEMHFHLRRNDLCMLFFDNVKIDSQ